jgi:hypothetical protein
VETVESGPVDREQPALPVGGVEPVEIDQETLKRCPIGFRLT